MPSFSSLIRTLTNILVPVAVLSTTYLYLYPIFQGCVFPTTDGSIASGYKTTLIRHGFSLQNSYQRSKSQTPLAPFRLLVLADPQLEGTSSIYDDEEKSAGLDTSTLGQRLQDHGELFREAQSLGQKQDVLQTILSREVLKPLKALRKKLDLWGNDYYLAHIFRTMHWWTRPSHVTVLGDLIGSQWVKDDEFAWRGARFWNRTFAGTTRVDDGITTFGEDKREKVFKLDDHNWETRLINIVGNHDVGYAGDITRAKLERFEKMYGKADWDVRFEMSPTQLMPYGYQGEAPSIHVVVVNSMLLDGPAWDYDLQLDTYNRLGDAVGRGRPVEDPTSFTLLLTHVPLRKEEGVCVDAPFFDFWGDDESSPYHGPGGLREQNHLSDYATRTGALETVFGMGGDLDAPAQGRGRRGLILTGHDHAGCDTFHFVPSETTKHVRESGGSSPTEDGEQKAEFQTTWRQSKWRDAEQHQAHTGVREITLRSMMGEFGGNAGLLSAWYDFSRGEWRYDIQMCSLGVQHYWWAVHVLDLVSVGLFLISMILPVNQPASTRASHSKTLQVQSPKLKNTPPKKQTQHQNHKTLSSATPKPKTINPQILNGNPNGTPKSNKKIKKP